MESNAVYYRRRMAEERAAAIHASHPRAREAHLEMSARYEERLSSLDMAERKTSEPLIDVA